MPITVISTAPTPTQATATSSGSDATGQGFADLLSGQLALNDPQQDAANALLSAGLTASDALPTDAAALLATLGLAVTSEDASAAKLSAKDTTSEDLAPEDAASLLAALGLAAVSPSAPAPLSETSNTTVTNALSAVSSGTGQSLKAEGETLSLKAEKDLSATALADDQAAKFAATLALAEKDAGAQSDFSDTAADGISSLASNVSVNASSHPVQHNSSLSVATPVRDQNWATDFSQKVVWLANNDKQSAQLTLNPEQMGPIEISLNIDNGNASVSFASANAEVRDAIETALPRLREMFASAGIALGQTNVGAESFSQ